jgi:AcrR family transcriptional regulator
MVEKKSTYFETYRPKISKDIVPSPAKDSRLIEKKQKQIVEGASKLFFQKGYHGTSIREIAEESGMSLGQLYHYISSKDDILFLLFTHMQQMWYEYVIDFGLEEAEDPLDRLIRAIRTSIVFAAKNRKLFQFIFTESKQLGKEHLKIILEMDNRNVSGFFHKLLEEVSKNHKLNYDPDLAARFLSFSTVFMALRGWNLRKWSDDEIIDFLETLIIKGLGLPLRKTK